MTDKIYVINATSSNVTVIDGATNATNTVAVGNTPDAVAVNTVTNKVYVANSGGGTGNTVTVIDGATNVTSTITVGLYPNNVAVDPVTNKVYVANFGNNGTGNTVTVIDGATNATSTVTVGTGPYAVGVNPVTNKIYVANETSHNLTVIDGATGTTSTVTVGTGPYAVAVNPVTNKIYVVNQSTSSNSMTVIDGATDATTTVPVGSSPLGVAVNSVTNKVYVANSGSNSVTVIDGATNATSTVTAGTGPEAVAVNPVTNRVYVANQNSNNVTVIDGATDAASMVDTGPAPYKVAVNPVTNKIYVPNNNSNTVTVIDGATNATTTVTVGSSPYGVAVNPATNKIYVTNEGDNTVSVIDGATNTVTTTISVGSIPNAAAANPVTNKIYVTNDFGTSVAVIDGATDTVTTTVPAGSQPWDVAVNQATNKIYVPNISSANVTVIDGATNATTTVPAGSSPWGVAVNPVTNMIYVSNSGSANVTVIDGATDTASATVPVGAGPHGIAVNAVTNKVYVANSGGGGSMTVIDGATNTPTTVPAGTSARALDVNLVTNTIYVANYVSTAGTVTVIDGASNTITRTVTTGTDPDAVAVNPVTNKVYAVDQFGTATGVTVIDVDGHQTVPLTTTVAGVVDQWTLSTINVIQTANRTPSFTVDVNSTYSSINPAATNPPPTQLYYEVDGANPSSLATATTGAGANPASFSLTVGFQQFGLHTLYVYAAYGNEGGQNNRSAGQGNSPEIGNLTAYLFLIVPIQTTTTVTADVTPQLVGQPVIFTAQIAPPAPVGVPDATGTVTFYEGTTVLGTGSVNSSGQATFTTSSLSLGSHTVTAAYSGDTNYSASTSGALTVSIVNTLPTTLELMGGDDQAAVYGTAFAQPLVVVLRLSNGNPVSGATVTFAGAGLSFSSGGVVTTNSSGQASVTATGAHVGILLATVTTPGVSETVSFALTVTPAPLTVTANSASRVYGAANPAFTGTVTGAVFSDTFTFSASTIALTNSPVGTYPITPSVTGTLSNYTVHSVDGTLTITPAPLTVTANNASRVYGGANPAFTGTVTGAVPGDTFTFSASTIALTSSPVGTYPITPSVTGTALSNYTVHSVDGTLTVTPAPLTVTAHNASRIFGQPNPTLTATITGFLNGDTSNVVSGAPILTTTATQTSPVGTYPITATQGTLAATNYGFAFFNGTLTVTNESGSITLTTLPNPVASGHEVTLTATVPAGATGTVTFDDGTTVLGTVTIVGSTATLVVSTLTVGSHTITAVYSGDTNFTSATSAVVILVVTPDFAVVSITPTQEIPPSASANFDIDIPSVTAPFINPVTLSASGLPSGASYTFDPATVTPGSAGATSILTVSLPQQSAMHRNMRTPLVLAVLLLPFAAVKRVRAKPPRLLLWLLLTITSFAVIAGCGTGGYFSQSQRTYTITVTGTSGSLVRSTTVTLTIE